MREWRSSTLYICYCDCTASPSPLCRRGTRAPTPIPAATSSSQVSQSLDTCVCALQACVWVCMWISELSERRSVSERFVLPTQLIGCLTSRCASGARTYISIYIHIYTHMHRAELQPQETTFLYRFSLSLARSLLASRDSLFAFFTCRALHCCCSGSRESREGKWWGKPTPTPRRCCMLVVYSADACIMERVKEGAKLAYLRFGALGFGFLRATLICERVRGLLCSAI